MTLCASCREDRLCSTVLVSAQPADAAHRMGGVRVQMCAPCLDRLQRSRERANPDLHDMVQEYLPKAPTCRVMDVFVADMTRDELMATICSMIANGIPPMVPFKPAPIEKDDPISYNFTYNGKAFDALDSEEVLQAAEYLAHVHSRAAGTPFIVEPLLTTIARFRPEYRSLVRTIVKRRMLAGA